MSITTYKYRIYANRATTDKLYGVLNLCRELYNASLQERRDAYETRVQRHPNYYDEPTRQQLAKEHAISVYQQKRDLVEIKEVLRPEYQDIASHVLQDVLFRLEKAYQRFFQRVKNGANPGYPRFQGRHRYTSFTYPDGAGWKLDAQKRPADTKGMVRVNLRLTKIGTVKLHLHRDMAGTIKTLTIKREAEQWYACFTCEIGKPAALQVRSEDVGIDLGVSHFAALSTGEYIENPRHYRKAEKKLKKVQAALSRKKRGSHRRKKAVQAVARTHRQIRNQRADFLHKESRKLVNHFQIIVFEDLQTTNLVKRPQPKQDEETGQYLPNGASSKAGLNKSISDAGWSQFVQYCIYKAAWAGGTLVQVDPKGTSQVCSGCGAVVKKTLEERWHSCTCGCELDRDTNAAKNILRAGYQQLSVGTRPTRATA
ncbi:MAG: RNA-guided endonuclease InsQ/TnpB family protein [Ktedonobacteraceae bacterium]